MGDKEPRQHHVAFSIAANPAVKTKLCEAVGVIPDRCSNLKINIPASGPIIIVAEMFITEEQADELARELYDAGKEAQVTCGYD